MRHALLFSTAAAALIVAAGMAADVGNLPPVGQRSTRNQSAMNMIAPDGAKANPFFRKKPVLTTNGLMVNPQLAKALRAEGEEEATPEIYGFVISASSYGQGYGLRKIPMQEGEIFTTVPGGAGYNQSVTSGAECDGIFFTNQMDSRYGDPYCVYYYAYDMNNNWMSMCNPLQTTEFLTCARDMATDPITGDIYACCPKTSAFAGYVLARVEYTLDSARRTITEYKRQAICDLDNILTGLFFTADGQLWGIDLVTDTDEDGNEFTKSSSLYKIDKLTGEMTLVGETGAKPYYVTSVCCDLYNTGKVFWAIKDLDNVGSLYTIDLETGAATKMFDFPNNEEVVAMFVPIQPSSEVPAAPANVKADFPEGGFNGTISFLVPDTLAGGQKGSGDVEWMVSRSGELLGSGTAAYGEEVSCDVTVPNAAQYQFNVRLKNEKGNGPRVTLDQFVGTGTPAEVRPTAVLDGDKIVVSWPPVTGAAYDRGYVDVENMTYKVVRYPDGTVVSEGQKECSYTETIDPESQFSFRQYGVYAVAGGTQSYEAKTGAVVFGKIRPPYTETFDNSSLIGYGDNAETGPYPNFDLDGSTLGHWYVHTFDCAATCSTGFGDENSWLMTPAVVLEAGKSYTLSFKAYAGYTTTDETKRSLLKVMMGPAQHPDGMTTTIMPETAIVKLKADPDFKVYDFTVPTTGDYYLGIQCCTKNGGVQVYIDDMTIEESPEPGLPGPPSSPVLQATATGALTATFKANAPTIDNRGLALTGTVDMNLEFEGELVETLHNITPGQAVTFNVTASKGGEAVGTVYASNEKGRGRSLSASCYLGFYDPRQASDVQLIRNDADRNFTLRWTAPTQDVKWNNLTAADMTFKVLGADAEGKTTVLVDNISGDINEITFSDPTVDFAGDQKFVYYGVVVCSNGGMSQITTSNVLPVGMAYAAPYKDSFSGEPAGIYSTDMSSSFGDWYVLDDELLAEAGVTSQDGDNGFLGYCVGGYNTQGNIQTGIIDLAGLDTPGVSFYIYNIYQNEGFDDNEIFIAVNYGTEKYYMLKAEPDQVGNYGKMNSWCKYSVSLEPVKGQKVSIMIIPTTKTYIWSFIDNLMIGNLPEVDLSAGPSAGSPLIEDGNSGLYVFNVINNGYNTVKDFSIDLLRNDKPVKTRLVRTIAPGAVSQFQIFDTPDVDAEEISEYKALVTAEGDADTSDNDSEPIITKIVQPAFPTVEVIEGEILGENGAHLSWTEPDLNYVPNLFTETFERADLWATSYPEWTFIDVDEAPINLGTGNGAFGDDFISGSKQSFVIVDVASLDEQRQNSVHFVAHSGTKYLMKCAPGNTAIKGDDWAITPELYGAAQTVTLWAHSHSSNSPENIEGLYSMGSLDPADFISISKHVDVPQGWTKYEFDLPEGAKRFAIRCYSNATFLIQIDDVTYQPMPFDLSLVGYHVWRNGVRITYDPIEDTSYVDAVAKEGDTYRISAVYHVGESVPSAPYTPDFNSIENVLTDDITINTLENVIYVHGAQDKTINVYSTDGTLVKSVNGLPTNAIIIDSGIYIVKVGSKTAKVVVK